MTYDQYIDYHKRGDAGVEERMIASLAQRLQLDAWQAFKLIYFYTMTYHIPSALRMLLSPNMPKQQELTFRTDRRYVRCNGAFDRLLRELTPKMLADLQACTTTEQAFRLVKSWYFFGRYAAFLFLEVYINVARPDWIDNLRFAWEPDENYTKGAVHIIGSSQREVLDRFLEHAKRDTQDNAFAIETSLCAVAKFIKGTRWDGYYTQRMLQEAENDPEYGALILSCL